MPELTPVQKTAISLFRTVPKTTGRLRSFNSHNVPCYCSLGVLVEAYRQHHPECHWDEHLAYHFLACPTNPKTSDYTLPDFVRPSFNLDRYPGIVNGCISFNDSHPSLPLSPYSIFFENFWTGKSTLPSLSPFSPTRLSDWTISELSDITVNLGYEVS